MSTNVAFTKTLEFRIEKINGNALSLLASIREANDYPDRINNQYLCSRVSQCIRENTILNSRVSNYGDVNEYCNKIAKGELCGDEVQLQALAIVCRLVIYIVSTSKSIDGSIQIDKKIYGESIESFKDCIYILCDEEHRHYDLLYVINMENLQEKTKIFKRNDKTITELLNIFLKKEFNYDIEMESDCNNKNVLEPTTGLGLRKRMKYNLTTSASNENNIALPEIQELLQTAIDFPQIIEEILTENASVILGNQNPVDRMRLEIEPAYYFRGRKATDFKPRKSTKRNGKPSEPMAPRYFSDRENHHYLKLLIPNAYLLGNLLGICLEICIVTTEINGYTYYHPYFKFQIHPTDMNSPNLNPRFIFLDNAVKLKSYSEFLKQLSLQLVVVMHTNRELMTVEQPLKVFSSTTSNDDGKMITERCDTHKEFKELYQLHQLRFAITPWIKSPGLKVFRRHADEQYISEISTEDKNTRIRRVKA